MATRGSKVELSSVSEQPHKLNYEANKKGTTAKNVEDAKKATGSNKRAELEKKLDGKNKESPLQGFLIK